MLIDNGSGTPTVADTFLPKTPSAPSAGPGTIVLIDRADFEHVWAHGMLAGTPALDVELKHALASLRTDDVATKIALEKVSLMARGLPQGVDPAGELQATLDIPAASDKPLGARAHYQGTAAQVPVVLDASYLDAKLRATLEAREISPAAARRQVPGLELRAPAALSASAEGKLPELHGAFSLAVGPTGKVDGDFELNLDDDLTAKANVRTLDLDLAELTRSAPASKLALTLRVAMRAPKIGPITGNFELASKPSVIAAQALPGLAVTGTIERDPRSQSNRVDAHAEVAEPGAQTSIDATVVQTKQTTVEFRSEDRAARCTAAEATRIAEPRQRSDRRARQLSGRGSKLEREGSRRSARATAGRQPSRARRFARDSQRRAAAPRSGRLPDRQRRTACLANTSATQRSPLAVRCRVSRSPPQ